MSEARPDWELSGRYRTTYDTCGASLTASREETARVKDALRQWQSRQARMVNSAGRY